MKGSPTPFTLLGLAGPLFLSQLVQTVIFTIDTLMLSNYSDLAVAAVGTVSQLLSTVNLLFGFATVGTGIVMSQLNGSGKRAEATGIAQTALIANLLLGGIASIVLFLFPEPILRAISLPEELIQYGTAFLSVTGLASFATAFIMTAEMTLRMNGMVKRMLLLSFTMVALNTVGNYMVLYEPFGLASYGVEGVAWVTFGSKLVGVALAVVLLIRAMGHTLFSVKGISLRLADLREIFKLGIPSAGENLSYSASQVVIMMIATLLGTTAITTKIYTQTLTGYIFLVSVSIGQATSIMIGHLIGAGDPEKARATGLRHLKIGLFLSVSVSLVLYLVSKPLMGLFTDDINVINMSANLILLSVLLEAARACNVIMIASLNASGEVKYPVMMGLILMWGVSIPAAYLFGIVWGHGIYGIWLAFIIDEWIRAYFMIRRWRSGKWRQIRLSAVNTNRTSTELQRDVGTI
ncbi:MATE family efflux transporter [Paenibacillus crassostreae]|uniref:MATE family efflux transporter n=1 Tax=Paenibacillus crassostreae TaxID=1763538 RepID=A0A167BEG1_9BACL|nr:MATE family efflux transporter [Paenibacillus crassostreae]AOZ92916.1 MATE family efflux transporter [Paenibacillus crassostreae]OAB71996.1 MATE family efflux transporter [Paenibacillus crassostreae]